MSVGECTWPSGTCKCWEAEQSKPDPHGRVWMHCEEGLSYSKASLARFMVFCLGNNVEIGGVHAFNPRFPRSQVSAAVRLKPSQFAAFERETGGKLRNPPRIVLSGGASQ